MTSWLSSLPLCCTPLASCIPINIRKRQRRSKSSLTTTTVISWPLGRSSDEELLMGQEENEKDNTCTPPIVYNQPLHQPQPAAVAVPATGISSHRSNHHQQQSKTTREMGFSLSLLSVRGGSSGKRRFWSSASSTSSRRPQISVPSDFRHVSSASPYFGDQEEASPPPLPQQLQPVPPPASVSSSQQPTSPAEPTESRIQRRSFRPLELSIYMPENNLSPLLPHFEYSNIVSPPPAYTLEQPKEERALARQRSLSAMSFHIPRKQLPESSHFTIEEEAPPTIPPRALARGRAYTAPGVNMIRDRVVSAMIEVERLQKQIDEVIERHSTRANSRPVTPQSVACTMPGESRTLNSFSACMLTGPDLEPMPSVPALPPAAPSFAERLNNDIERPSTAPVRGPLHRSKPHNEPSAAFRVPAWDRRDEDGPLSPPLPLVLRPPLRKKISFSRVSTWLLGSEHKRGLSVDSVTNMSRPVKDSEGFYQIVSLGETSGRRPSLDSVGTVTTWVTDDEGEAEKEEDGDDEHHTAPTISSPGGLSVPAQDSESIISRTATVGKSDVRPGRVSVGVAF